MEELKPTVGVTRPQATERNRQRAIVYRRRRILFGLGFVALCLVIAGIALATNAGTASSDISAQTMLGTNSRPDAAPVDSGGTEHPVFARWQERNLLLPVPAKDATIIAYQPVADERAAALTPLGEQINTNALVRFFRGIFASPPPVRYYLLEGKGEKPTSSALVGAAPGTPVYAPVSGVVTAVTRYLLYGKYEDVQIDIRPEKSSGATLSLILIADPVVSIGQPVIAGKTQLGKVRECPEQLGKTLSVYTHDSGAHIHMQITEVPIR